MADSSFKKLRTRRVAYVCVSNKITFHFVCCCQRLAIWEKDLYKHIYYFFFNISTKLKVCITLWIVIE